MTEPKFLNRTGGTLGIAAAPPDGGGYAPQSPGICLPCGVPEPRNDGMRSTKFNEDCTICVFAVGPERLLPCANCGRIAIKWREHRVKWRPFGGPLTLPFPRGYRCDGVDEPCPPPARGCPVRDGLGGSRRAGGSGPRGEREPGRPTHAGGGDQGREPTPAGQDDEAGRGVQTRARSGGA